MNSTRVTQVQKRLQEEKLDGWLLYDFRRTNDLACRFLGLAEEKMLTRRFFYWIPVSGTPIKLVHRIELNVLDHLPGNKLTYSSWEQLEKGLQSILKGQRHIAMEYSPRNAIPYLSKVDGGTLELVQNFGVQLVSSGDLLQNYTSVWSDEQLKLHLEAAGVLDTAVNKAWELISHSLKTGRSLNEWDVQQFILEEFKKMNCISEDPPICAVNAHSADPHYQVHKTDSSPIREGDFILIDLWCKKKQPKAVYADITRVAIASSAPSVKQQKIFNIVKEARDAAMAFIRERLNQGKLLMGWEVDQVCRNSIAQAGFGEYFTHRTGHNIGERDHGDGANIDNFETKDTRRLLPGTCFSIEPGIYLPGEFGVRLEHDVYIEMDGRYARVTGGLQENLLCLLKHFP